MAETTTKPDIRFAGFTDAWEQRKLGEITTKIGSGKTPKGGAAVYLQTGIPLLRSQNIVNDMVDFSDAVYISEAMDIEMSNSRVCENDVLLNITGASIGRSAVYRFAIPANVNQHVCIVRAKAGINSEFIQLNLTSQNGQQQIENNQAGGGREGLNFQKIAEISFGFPSFAEQTVIGNFFCALDAAITLHQHEHDKTVNVKKSMLEKMFPKEGADRPEIRFAGFTGTWEQWKLGDTVKIVGGATPSKVNPDYWNGDIVWLSSQEIKERYVSEGTYKITEKAVRESATKVVPAFTPLIVSRSGILARMFPITLPTVDVAINQDIKALFFDEKFLDKDFFVSQLEMQESTILSETVKTGTTVQSVNMPDFEKLLVSVPTLREQRLVGAFFTALDRLIALHQRELTKLQNMKKALLGKMFV